MAKKKQSVTQKLRSNVKAAIKRRIAKGINIPESVVQDINNMTWQKLKSLSANKYQKLDNLINKLQYADDVPKESTTKDKLFINERINKAVKEGYIRVDTPDQRKEYESLFKYIMSTPISQIRDEKSASERAARALWILNKDPELFNSSWRTENIQPNANNTADQLGLIYDSIMSEIETAFDSGNGGERFLAMQLEKMLDAQIEQYGRTKALLAIDMCDGYLLETAIGFIYDSNQFQNDRWKSSLAEMAYMIQGYIDDATLEALADAESHADNIISDNDLD